MKDWKYINGAEVGNQDGVARMFEGLVKDEKKETEKDSGAIKDLEKVGNASTGDFVALINRALKIAKEKPEKASRMNQIVSFLKSAHNLPGDRWQYHIDRISKELDEVGNKVGNQDGVARMFEGLVKDENKETEKDSGAIEDLEKVGNATPNYRYKGFLITNPEGYEYVVFLQDGYHVAFRGTTSKAMAEDWCDYHDPKTNKPVAKFRNTKTGNSASDDKFAYVMREFDEGKLKTPDGKVVTDPEQAKAIAYSESKKAENGLDRAWEAMKDKH